MDDALAQAALVVGFVLILVIITIGIRMRPRR